jgi:hypothetical protein
MMDDKIEQRTHLAVECKQISLIKREESSHQNIKDDSARPDVSHCTIIALVVKDLAP